MTKKIAIGIFWSATLLATACGYFSIKHLVIPTEGMSPTINPGDHLACAGIKNNELDPIERFDIVAFHRQPVPSRGIEASTLFVQRIIGMPGESIEVRKGVIYVDGKILDESSFRKVDSSDDRKDVRLPESSYFVLGDNRPNSEDSRYIGAVSRSDIECRVTNIISKADYDSGKRW